MKILSVTKILNEDGSVNIYKVNDAGVKRFVPLDEGNCDYQEVLGWVSDGGVIQGI